MCGIAGIVAPSGFDPSKLFAMTKMIQYRGPDGFGFAFTRPGAESTPEISHNEYRLPRDPRPIIGLGARRLAILDLSSSGNQPMSTDDGRLTITFNGEIYNYREIRDELANSGHRFQTGTDTEVILRAYRQWGPVCLEHFNGMWSFALWDRDAQKLFCARDRFGVKPFYYAIYDGALYFASEIKQILEGSGMPRRANPRTIFRYLEWSLVDHSSETFFEGIHQLQGGHSLTIDMRSPLQPEIHRYWELRVDPQLEISDAAATEEFQRLFDNAVKIRLRSDVPVGVALSGGLDSSAVLCKAKQVSPEIQFQTFSACFEDPEIDERTYISTVIHAANGVGHLTFPQGHAFWEKLRSMIYHHDEPVGSTAAFAQWCVMAEAQKFNVPVVLSGQGGDESLCGYQKYQFFYLWHLFRAADPAFFRASLMLAIHGTTSYATVNTVTRYLPTGFRGPFSLTKRVCSPELLQLHRDARSGLGSALSIADRQKIDLTYSSIPALLHYEDRNSMAHSIESRLPFLDYKLVEFSLRCPSALKLRDGWSKWLLRNSMIGTLPESIRLRRTKLGFNTPENQWMHIGLTNGQREMWEKPALRMSRFLDGAKLKQECEKFLHRAKGALPAAPLFRAISLELWAQVYSVS